MSQNELEIIDNKSILLLYKKASELLVKNDGNGKSPFDIFQLQEEILRRMSNQTEKALTPGEEYDLHDELS